MDSLFQLRSCLFIEPYRHGRHHSSKLLAYAVMIVTNQTAKKHGTTRANMPRKTNEGVMILCKTITANLLTIVGLLVEPITSLEKPKGFIWGSLFNKQHPITLTSKYTVISSSLSSFLFLSSILISNSRNHRIIGY